MTSTQQHPTYAQLVDLPAFAEQPVPVAFEDNNGHLNVRHYLGIGSEGLDQSLVDLGIPLNWPVKAGHACLAAEHHVTYLRELRTGDSMSGRRTRWSTSSTTPTSGSRASSRRSSCTW